MKERSEEMFRMIVLVIIVAVFAKPTYEFVTDFLETGPQTDVQQVTEAPKAEAPAQVNAPVPTTSPTQNVTVPNTIDSLEKLTDAFYMYFSEYNTNFTIEYRGSTANIDDLIQRAVTDALARDSYIQGHLSERQIQYEYSKVAATIHVQQSYLTNAQQEKIVDTKIASLVSKVNTATMTDFEKVKFVNDYIVQNTQYSDATSTSAHSAYTLIAEGKAVCQGYALFATKFLRALGLEAMYVTGEVYTGGHAWNLVKVDGEWYHLDTTWNDPVPDRGNGVRYNYFLISDEALSADHVWQRADYPKALSEKYLFMHVVQDSYEKDGYMYYSHTEQDNQLYRLNIQTGENVQLSSTRALFITGVDEWLYFSNYSNGAYLSKMRIDGSDEMILYEQKVNNLFVESGFIYFTVDGEMKKMAL